MKHRHVELGNRVACRPALDVDGSKGGQAPTPALPHKGGGRSLRESQADPVAGRRLVHRGQEGRSIRPRKHMVMGGESSHERRRVESFQIVENTMGGQDDQARILDIDQQHQHIVEGGIWWRLRMLMPLLVSEVQGRLVTMMAIGDVQTRGTENRGQFLYRLGSAQGPDRVLVAIHTSDRQLRRPRHRRDHDRTDGRPGIFVQGKDRTEVGLHRPGQ